ncbi:MAG: CocE/NonD family hydrolase [Acidimicrobiales bacterium]
MGIRSKLAFVVVAAALVAAACTSSSGQQAGGPSGSSTGGSRPAVDTGAQTTSPAFKVTPGVEQLTITEAKPKTPITLVGADNRKILTLVTDDKGQAVFSYVPNDYSTFETGNGKGLPTTDGQPLKKGTYSVRDESASPVQSSGAVEVLGRDDHPPTSLYEQQKIDGVPWQVLGSPMAGHQAEEGFGYIKMRDGVELSAMVRLPDPRIYGDGPYPTVIEYSGYSPSDPKSPQPGSMIATAFGFATVGVNMRGTGCSGGVFDVFTPQQQADGYDVVEAVARQPWVKGNKVGMVGLSYSGISQLYVASTRPPSLAAITPLSVIEDSWKMVYPGGIYNAGFTKQWLEERNRQAKSGGQSWTQRQIDGGDQTCAKNQDIRSQNIDFQELTKGLEFRPPDADARDLSILVKDIDVPVYLTGAGQDEQTGPRFATMLQSFTSTDKAKFVLFNGHHPDGYAPTNLTRWLEFLQLYVGKQVPKVNDVVRQGSAAQFEDAFGAPGLALGPDRFADLQPDQYQQALARWEADPKVTVRFEAGAADGSVPGAPVGRFEAGFSQWPPKEVQPWTLYFGPDGALTTDKPTAAGADKFQFDPEAGPIGYASANAYDFQKPTVKADWTQTPDGKGLSYVTAPLTQDTIIAGAGHVDLWMKSDAPDAVVEVVLSEITPDGTEFRIQNGLLRAGDRKVDPARSDDIAIQQTFRKEDYQPLPAGEYTKVQVPIFPVAAPLRAGSKLRVQVNTPGRDLPLWFFENPDFGNPTAWQTISRSPDQASSIVLPVLPAGQVAVPAGHPPCPSLRGQVCRPYAATTNTAATP